MELLCSVHLCEAINYQLSAVTDTGLLQSLIKGCVTLMNKSYQQQNKLLSCERILVSSSHPGTSVMGLFDDCVKCRPLIKYLRPYIPV